MTVGHLRFTQPNFLKHCTSVSPRPTRIQVRHDFDQWLLAVETTMRYRLVRHPAEPKPCVDFSSGSSINLHGLFELSFYGVKFAVLARGKNSWFLIGF